MGTHQKLIHKINRPKLVKVFQRERLFRMLDDNRNRSVIWVTSPAGAGKTTLITSFLESRHLDNIWYQIDGRDADPASFFHYMSQAFAKAGPRKPVALPVFSSEFISSIDTFALRYFETAFHMLSDPTMIVLDNFQIIPGDSILPALIATGLSVVPDHIQVIVISRERPPSEFSRFLANRKMVQLEWRHVRLTQEETAGIAQMVAGKPMTGKKIQNLHQIIDGWAAGLILMIGNTDVDDTDRQHIEDFSEQEIFNYFSREVFERESADTQDFLLRISFLPYVSIKMAKALSGQPRAGQILAELHLNGRFTELRRHRTRLYEFHPLFKEFLKSRAEARYSDHEIQKLHLEAAKLLQKEGDPETAADLLCQAQAYRPLAELIMNNAFTFLQQGRNRTILNWLAKLPQSIIAETPWLLFWQGTATIPFEPGSGHHLLGKAFHAFRTHKDAAGLFLSWSWIVRDIFLEMADISSFDHWIQVLKEIMDEYKEFPNKMIEGQVVAGMLLMLTHRQMHHPDIKGWIERAHALLDHPLDLNTKVSLINNTAHYYMLTGASGKAAHVLDRVTPEELTGPVFAKGIIANVAYATILSHFYCYTGEHDQCLETVFKGLDYSKHMGVNVLTNILIGYGIWSSLMHEDPAAAEKLFTIAADYKEKVTPLERGLFDVVLSLKSLSQGDLNKAVVYAESGLQASIAVGSQFTTIFCRLVNARVVHAAGNRKEASKQLAEAFRLSEATRSKHFLFHALILKARFTLEEDRKKQGLSLLNEGFSLGSEIELYHNMIDSRSNMAKLCAIALEHDIEAAYAKTYICKRNLLPNQMAIETEKWPWPLKIHTLGRFSLVKNGVPMQFPTKAQKKPLDFLKAVIAMGGRDVSKAQIEDALWPDADGDKARQSFSTTLHRLRNLLGNDAAIQIQDGKLKLNPSYCWVDCWVFERLLSRAEAVLKTEDMARSIKLFEKALQMYQGAYLSGDEAEAYAVSKRERLQSRFLSSLHLLAGLLKTEGHLDRASDYYQRSLDVDDLSEETYRHLMGCLQRLGRRSEAISVFRRCETALKAKLGVGPSRKTEAIYKSLIDRQ